ncbi:FecR family protein [Olivibacter sp. XZL3]|uniref:FecR family protein n=1 Tax=Olivibacter sp. XZL3 TaxID=1735116 RepID=UPI001066216D|nr:FecR family protein [Olivibacter sp. XZL3]
MDQEKIHSLLEKYLNGTCSQQEKESIDAWFESDRHRDRVLTKGKAMELEEEILTHVKNRLSLPTGQRNRRRSLWFSTGIAASILLLLGGLIFFTMHHRNREQDKQPTAKLFTFHTEPGQKAKLRLPDSSIVWLNGNTAIRYDQKFTGATRAIYLDSGEAFFEVHPHPRKPFIVHTAELQTQVLGTSFNIQVKDHRNQYILSINTGKVNLIHSQHKLPNTLLSAGQEFSYHYNKDTYKIQPIQPGNEHAWIYNELVFQNASWKKVVAQLETWYGIRIHLNLQKGRHETFTARFEDPTLESVLKALQKINRFRYTINKKEVHISN